MQDGLNFQIGAANDAPERESDAQVWSRICRATNAQKIIDLCEGRWQQYGYSEIDGAVLSLLNMLAFHSPNDNQCLRLFRQTPLSQQPHKDYRSQMYGPMKAYWLRNTMDVARMQINEQQRKYLEDQKAAQILSDAWFSKLAQNPEF